MKEVSDIHKYRRDICVSRRSCRYKLPQQDTWKWNSLSWWLKAAKAATTTLVVGITEPDHLASRTLKRVRGQIVLDLRFKRAFGGVVVWMRRRDECSLWSVSQSCCWCILRSALRCSLTSLLGSLVIMPNVNVAFFQLQKCLTIAACLWRSKWDLSQMN